MKKRARGARLAFRVRLGTLQQVLCDHGLPRRGRSHRSDVRAVALPEEDLEGNRVAHAMHDGDGFDAEHGEAVVLRDPPAPLEVREGFQDDDLLVQLFVPLSHPGLDFLPRPDLGVFADAHQHPRPSNFLVGKLLFQRAFHEFSFVCSTMLPVVYSTVFL
jgi:hypothetical protein